jgi:basic amino acid/polyamine antiporter, APA family
MLAFSQSVWSFDFLLETQLVIARAMQGLLRRMPVDPETAEDAHMPRHLGWLMLTALGVGGTIGAGIFAMPGMIALKAGPSGILSFFITGLIILFVAICYERFSLVVPNGVSAYSYVYHSIGELPAWIVAIGLFVEYSFGTSAVAIAWAEYLKKSFGYQLPLFWSGPSHINGVYHFGINIVAAAVILLVTVVLIIGGASKSARLNFALVCLKLMLLVTFLIAGLKHANFANWQPFMPKGWTGVMQGAALAVFPYVGFDALYTFAREAKSLRDTRLATYYCVAIVAFLYITVMAVATALAPCFIDGHVDAPNQLFVGSEAAAPLASLLAAAGEVGISRLVAVGAVLGIFNVLLVFSMGGPRIFRNMSEDGLLPPIFQKVHKGNPTIGIILNGIVMALMAGLLAFGDIAQMMVLGTLIAFMLVCIGAYRLKIVPPIISMIGLVGCFLLAINLGELVLKVYFITMPLGLVFYFCYGKRHSKLAHQ